VTDIIIAKVPTIFNQFAYISCCKKFTEKEFEKNPAKKYITPRVNTNTSGIVRFIFCLL
jgi:hypothetical protein